MGTIRRGGPGDDRSLYSGLALYQVLSALGKINKMSFLFFLFKKSKLLLIPHERNGWGEILWLALSLEPPYPDKRDMD